MASFNDTFKRIEKKYRLNAKQYEALISCLDQRMRADEYGKSTITSFYLDTANYDLICRSLEKPLYKEKLRVRYYGTINTLNNTSAVFLEIKKKYKGIVYKRRLCISWAAAKAFLSGVDYCWACTSYPLDDSKLNCESISPKSLQIAREIQALIGRFDKLTFSIAISCERTAYTRSQPASPLEIEDDLRITFDENIRYFSFRGTNTKATQLLKPQERLMEIKAVGSFPLWLSRALSDCDIKPSSFSKYGEAFKSLSLN